MKRLILAVLLCVPVFAFADYLNVATYTMNPECGMVDHAANKARFLKLAKARSWEIEEEILISLTGDSPFTIIVIDRYPNVSAFGKQMDEAFEEYMSKPQGEWRKFMDDINQCYITKTQNSYASID